MAGGGSGGGSADAGCQALLCLTGKFDDGGVPQCTAAAAAGGDNFVVACSTQNSNTVRLVSPVGGDWKATATGYYFYGADGLSKTDFWFADPLIEHFTSVNNNDLASDCAYDAGPYWYSASVRSKDEAWFAGTDNALCRWRSDAGFEPQNEVLAGMTLWEVWVGPGGRVITGGADGLLRQLDGGIIDAGFGGGVIDIHGIADDDFWAVADSSNFAAHVVGNTVTRLPLPNPGHTVRALSASEVWVGGYEFLMKLDGGEFGDVGVAPIGGAVGRNFYFVRENGADELLMGGSLNNDDHQGFVYRFRRQGH